MSIHTVFEFTTADHCQAARAVTRYTPARYLSWVATAAAMIMAAWTAREVRSYDSSLNVFWNALPWLLLAIFWIMLTPLTAWRTARKLPGRDASVIGPQERSVDADGYHSLGNGVRLDVPWHAMVRAAETDRFLLFFYNKQSAYYIPKRTLTPVQISEARVYMRQGLGERAVLQPG
jgi:hypothetical protein